MGKFQKNSGKLRQDAVLSQFAKDARSTNTNSAWQQCKAAATRNRVKVKQEVRMSYKFLTTGE